MTVEELFKMAAEDVEFKVSVHDRKYEYLETPDGDQLLYVNFSSECEDDADLATLFRVWQYHIVEWWVTFDGGIIHIMVEEDIVN